MGFKCGIIGLPNVGKSTVFNALTKSRVAAENYPFCTINPNIGVVHVPDKRLNKISEIVHPIKIISTIVEFVDIAGLVNGASKGEGLGNKFLSHIREVQAVAHVVRCFEDSEIVHVKDTIDPIRDIEIINTELILADLQTVEKLINKISKIAKTGNKQAINEYDILKKVEQHLNGGFPLRTLEIDNLLIRQYQFLTAKPILYLANLDYKNFEKNENSYMFNQVKRIVEKENALILPICAALEAEISELDEIEKIEFLKSVNLEESGLNKLIREGYKLLKLNTFFTAGPKEVRAWTIFKNTTSVKAAGVIHGDFEKGFIKALIIHYNDFINCGGEQKAKEMGKLNIEGRDYIVQDGDIIHFLFKN